jgi:hypothetical protein
MMLPKSIILITMLLVIACIVLFRKYSWASGKSTLAARHALSYRNYQSAISLDVLNS